jgi:hypothetical protein
MIKTVTERKQEARSRIAQRLEQYGIRQIQHRFGCRSSVGGANASGVSGKNKRGKWRGKHTGKHTAIFPEKNEKDVETANACNS